MTLALARKYRPRTFAEMMGQEHVIQALTHALEQNRLHHAYLLTGTRGVGKTTIARIIAKALNCETGITPAPCGVCETCKAIDAGRYVDLLELDAASNTQVDNMRELLENALYAPTAGRFKVYIIDEVHMLSRSAFNAMLKTLEEPPEHVKFILATTDPQKIPVTVLSRCLQFGLKQLSPAQIRAQLDKVLALESLTGESGALSLLARAARGSMRDALSLLDQAIVHGAGQVAEAGVREMLGIVDSSYLYTLLELVAAADGKGLLEQADAIDARGLSFDTTLQDLASLLHRVALAQTLPDAIAADEPDRDRLFALAEHLPPEDVQLHYQIALRGRADLALAPDERAGFTMTLIRMLAFRPETGGTAPAPAAPALRRAPMPAAGSSARPDPARAAAPTRQDAPESASAPSPAPRPQAEGPAVRREALTRENWPQAVASIRWSTMAKMLAQHCELQSVEGNRLVFAVPPRHKSFLEQTYRERFTAALREHWPDLRPEFVVGEEAGEHTLAAHEDRERTARQQGAVDAIDADPFVRRLRDNFDARLVDGSVQPMPSQDR